MPMTARQLVEISLESAKAQARDEDLALYQRFADHADDRLGDSYFPQYYGETADRYAQRPKESLPLCSSAIEVLSGAAFGDGVQVTIGDPEKDKDGDNEIYQQIAERNGLHEEFGLALMEEAGTFGWVIERPIPAEDQDDICFERVNPLVFEAHHDNGAIGRSQRALYGASFHTVFDLDDQSILPRDTSIMGASKEKRTEIITDEIWQVYLGNELAPANPLNPEDRWMIDDEGIHPYGVAPFAALWNIKHSRYIKGRSDLDPAYRLAEKINHIWSDLVYNLQFLFPSLTVPRPSGSQENQVRMGIGFALEYPEAAAAPSYIWPPLDVETFMAPFRTALNLFFSAIHTPASSHGLGAVFGEAKAAESGKAKFYEFNRLQQHVLKKRTNYEAFLKERYRVLAHVLNAPKPWGMGYSLDPDAPVHIEWASQIVPQSDQEIIEQISFKLEKQLVSHIEAILQSRGWADTPENRERAQGILDDIGAAKIATQGKTALDKALEDELSL